MAPQALAPSHISAPHGFVLVTRFTTGPPGNIRSVMEFQIHQVCLIELQQHQFCLVEFQQYQVCLIEFLSTLSQPSTPCRH